jgi:hypothetical protein
LTVTFWPVAVVSVNPEEDKLLTMPADPPAAGPDRALDAAPDPSPSAGLLLAAGVVPLLAAAVPGVLLQAATVAITAAAAPAAMTLLRLLENMRLTPGVEILDLRYRRARRKFGGKSLEGDREVVRHELTAKASPSGPQGHAKVTGSARSAEACEGCVLLPSITHPEPTRTRVEDPL